MRRTLAGLLFATVVAAACGTSIPSPSPRATPTAPASAPTALDECDPLGLIACQQQGAFISIPISDTGLALTWSSQWAPGRTDRPGWDASSLGLGGWSIDVVKRYQAPPGILISGDGSWRFAAAVKLAAGGAAVPAYDGSLAYIFDAAGRHVQTVDGHLGTTLLTITYDSTGRLATVDGTSNGGPAHLSIKRAADGTAQAIVGIDGATTAVGYDGQSRLTSITDPAGRATSFAWATGGLVTSETDPLGGVTRFTYDQDGRLVAASDADGVSVQFTRSATATSAEMKATTALGRTTTYRSEAGAGGITRTVVAADGTTTIETTMADGSRSISLPDGTTRTIGATPSKIWGEAVPLLTPDVVKRPDGVTSTTQVQEALAEVGGLPYSISGTMSTTLNGATSVETFDPGTRTATTVDGAGRKTVDKYDPTGRIVSESAPGTARTTYTYDQQGRETSQTLGTGSAAQTTRFAFDATTGRETVTRADGSTLSLTVDADGHLATTAAADGATEVFAYDASGRLTEVQPAGGLSFTLGYSPAGRSTAFLPPSVADDASAQVAAYDGDGEATSVSGLGVNDFLTYDNAGRLVATTTDAGKTTLAYDQATGLESSSADPGGVSAAYGYTGSQLTSVRWTGPLTGSVSITIDANGRAVTQTADTAAPLSLTHDAAGDLTSVGGLSLTRDATGGLVTGSSVGTVSTQQEYDAADRLVRSVTTAGGRSVLDLSYTRDALGRIVGVVERSAAGTTTTNYTFEASDRLSAVRVNGKNVETDAYDAAGNRTATTGPSGTTRGAYDARDRLVSWGGASYTWRADGRLVKVEGPAGQTTFDYDDAGNLRSAKLADGTVIHYLVDADGRRLGREVDGKLVAGYLYDPSGRLVAQTDATGAVTEQFGYDDQEHLAVMEKQGTTYRVITDAVGSPRSVIDAKTGSVADAIAYDAWGRVTNATAPGLLPVGFAGGLADPSTGLVHFGARDYDPTTGRWTGADPIGFAGGDPNLYRYAGEDPIDQSDPSGLQCHTHLGEQVPCNLPPPTSKPPTATPSAPPLAPPWAQWHCSGIGCQRQNTVNPQNLGNCDVLIGSCQGGPNGTWTCSGIGCEGPGGGACLIGSCGFGDTHMETADRTHFDFQAAGEFLIATSPDGRIQVQTRQEPVMGGTVITFTTAVAANVDGDRVGVYAKEPSFLVVDGQPVNAVDIAEQLPHGGALERHGGRVTVGWPDGSQLLVSRNGSTLDYTLVASKAAGPTLRGLLGNADGNPANDLTGRDGSVLSRSDPDFHTKLYAQFGNSWRVSQATSLFDYGPGESTATFTNLAIPSAEATVASLSASGRTMAQTICQAAGVRVEPLLDDCILDVGETGDASFAADTAAVAASGATVAGTQTSPAQVTPITAGQTVSGQIASTFQEDEYTFTGIAGQAVYLQAHATCNGSLSWDVVGPSGGLLADERVCVDLQRVELRTSGTYTIRINNDRSASGAYGFSLLAVPATVVTPISIGQTVSGALTAPGQLADYTFDASAGATITAHATGACVNGLGWQLLGPAGNLLDFNVACRDMTGDRLSVSGTYTVRVFGERTTVGAYTFVIRAGP
ncbi:MAG TPA: RHS repeat-associated core domain-containing protein [Candidatus Limnocylindrales bacterium]